MCILCWNFRTIYEGQEQSRNMVVVPVLQTTPKARTFKLLRSPGIDIKGSIPPAYVAWRAGTITLFLLSS
jgi:hypothetical protein